MKTYKTNNNTTISKIGRMKKINYTMYGAPFFIWNGRRYHFENVPRLSYPIMYTDDDGRLCDIGGYIGISNCFSVLVEIIDGGEAVQLWEEVACE